MQLDVVGGAFHQHGGEELVEQRRRDDLALAALLQGERPRAERDDRGESDGQQNARDDGVDEGEAAPRDDRVLSMPHHRSRSSPSSSRSRRSRTATFWRSLRRAARA